MAFSEIELKSIENTVGKTCQRRSPPHLADQLRTIYKIKNHSIEVYEHRPRWNNPEEWIDEGIAKFLYSRTTKRWNLYWMTGSKVAFIQTSFGIDCDRCSCGGG